MSVEYEHYSEIRKVNSEKKIHTLSFFSTFTSCLATFLETDFDSFCTARGEEFDFTSLAGLGVDFDTSSPVDSADAVLPTTTLFTCNNLDGFSDTLKSEIKNLIL